MSAISGHNKIANGELDGDAFVADEDVVEEITAVRYPGHDAQIGVVLLSSKERYQLCDKSLYCRLHLTLNVASTRTY